ncbi:hypothetical protein [Vibrio sp. Hal054]|uniref:hypothetical protein n=1 Tax=Vibrio sp. Hal054 TaxID=3035158 RepID=UPI00301C46BE
MDSTNKTHAPARDEALEAILAFNSFQKRECINWFLNMWLSIALVMLSYGIYKQVTSVDVNRSYVAVNPEKEPINPISTRLPINTSDKEIGDWMLASLRKCLNFDWRSYAFTKNKCNADIFAMTKMPFSQVTRGEDFYNKLEESGITGLLITNKTSMDVSIQDVELVSKGLRTYSYEQESGDPSELPKLETESFYVYEFNMMMTINMVGQKLDAPIRYQVLLQRTSQLVRENGLSIRSVLSLE